MPQRTVFIAHYDQRHLENLEKELRKGGYSVHTFADGESILVAAAELGPDVVIVEAMLPRRNGFEVCRRITTGRIGRKIPVLITSSVLQGTRYRDEAINSYGCVEFLGRGSSKADLLKVLSGLSFDDEADAPAAVAAPPAATAVAAEPGPEERDAQPSAVAEPSTADTVVLSSPVLGDRAATGAAASETRAASPSSEESAAATVVLPAAAAHETVPAPAPETGPVARVPSGQSLTGSDPVVPQILTGNLDEEALVEALDEIFDGAPATAAPSANPAVTPANATASPPGAPSAARRSESSVTTAVLEPEPPETVTETADGPAKPVAAAFADAGTVRIDAELAESLRTELEEPDVPETAGAEERSPDGSPADRAAEAAASDGDRTLLLDAGHPVDDSPRSADVLPEQPAPSGDGGSVVDSISPRKSSPPVPLFEHAMEPGTPESARHGRTIAIAAAAAGLLIVGLVSFALLSADDAPIEQPAGPRISRASAGGLAPAPRPASNLTRESPSGAGYLSLPEEQPGDVAALPEKADAAPAAPAPSVPAKPAPAKPSEPRPTPKPSSPPPPAVPSSAAKPVVAPERPASVEGESAANAPANTGSPVVSRREARAPRPADPEPTAPSDDTPAVPQGPPMTTGSTETTGTTTGTPRTEPADARSATNGPAPDEATSPDDVTRPERIETDGEGLAPVLSAEAAGVAVPPAASETPPEESPDGDPLSEDAFGPESEAGTGTGFSYPTHSWDSSWDDAPTAEPSAPAAASGPRSPDPPDRTAGDARTPDDAGAPAEEAIPQPGAPVDLPPRATVKSPPDFPVRAREAGIQGRVVLQILVLETGEVGRVRVTDSPSELLSDAALSAAMEWTYEPARRDGRAVAAWTTESVSFRLR